MLKKQKVKSLSDIFSKTIKVKEVETPGLFIEMNDKRKFQIKGFAAVSDEFTIDNKKGGKTKKAFAYYDVNEDGNIVVTFKKVRVANDSAIAVTGTGIHALARLVASVVKTLGYEQDDFNDNKLFIEGAFSRNADGNLQLVLPKKEA